MNNDGWIGKKGFRYWYYRYRDSEYFTLGIVGVSIVVCLALIFTFIIPEISQWFSIQTEVATAQQRISVLQNNINFMNNLNKGTIDEQLQVASQALPPQKDFGIILQSISSAALSSGVALGDYTFSVGNITSTKVIPVSSTANQVPGLPVTVIITGSFEQVRRFIGAIENNSPIAEVISIDGSGKTISLTIQFYEKPFPTLSVTGDTPLIQLSPKQSALLKQLANGQKKSGAGTIPQPVSSASAIPLF
jgi:hypothetical protein